MEFNKIEFKPGDKLSAAHMNYMQSVIGTLCDEQSNNGTSRPVSKVVVTDTSSDIGGAIGIDIHFVGGGSETSIIQIGENGYPDCVIANGNIIEIEWSDYGA